MEYIFLKEVFDTFQEIREIMEEEGFQLIEATHFNFVTSFPNLKYPTLKILYQKENRLVMWTINSTGYPNLLAAYTKEDF